MFPNVNRNANFLFSGVWGTGHLYLMWVLSLAMKFIFPLYLLYMYHIYLYFLSFVLLSFTFQSLSCMWFFFPLFIYNSSLAGSFRQLSEGYLAQVRIYVRAYLLKTKGSVLRSFSYFLSCSYQVFRKLAEGEGPWSSFHRSRLLQFSICRMWLRIL